MSSSSGRSTDASPHGRLTGAEYSAMRDAITVEKRVAHSHASWEKKAAQARLGVYAYEQPVDCADRG
jgi:hypothetical protein